MRGWYLRDKPLLQIVLFTVVFGLLAYGAGVVVDQNLSQDTDTEENTPRVDIDSRCIGDECTVYLHVLDLHDASYVSMQVIDNISGRSETYTVNFDGPAAAAHTGEVDGSPLFKRDMIIVEAVYPDGDREILAHRTLEPREEPEEKTTETTTARELLGNTMEGL